MASRKQSLGFFAERFFQHIGRVQEKNEKVIAEQMEAAVNVVFDELAGAAPQWSGHMASNLTISINDSGPAPTSEFKVGDWHSLIGGNPHEPYGSGHPNAIGTAEDRNTDARFNHTYDRKDKIMFTFKVPYEIPDDLRGVNYQGDVFQKVKQLIGGSHRGNAWWKGATL